MTNSHPVHWHCMVGTARHKAGSVTISKVASLCPSTINHIWGQNILSATLTAAGWGRLWGQLGPIVADLCGDSLGLGYTRCLCPRGHISTWNFSKSRTDGIKTLGALSVAWLTVSQCFSALPWGQAGFSTGQSPAPCLAVFSALIRWSPTQCDRESHLWSGTSLPSSGAAQRGTRGGDSALPAGPQDALALGVGATDSVKALLPSMPGARVCFSTWAHASGQERCSLTWPPWFAKAAVPVMVHAQRSQETAARGYME